tara:strand:+ start:1455 stop:1853 length:399 start_codon:yes stop_codon:yes gene_type:complete
MTRRHNTYYLIERSNYRGTYQGSWSESHQDNKLIDIEKAEILFEQAKLDIERDERLSLAEINEPLSSKGKIIKEKTNSSIVRIFINKKDNRKSLPMKNVQIPVELWKQLKQLTTEQQIPMYKIIGQSINGSK